MVAFVVVVVALSVWGVLVALAAGKVMAGTLDAKDALYRARDEAVALRFEAALSELEAADTYLEEAQSGMPVLRTASFVPWVGDQIVAVDAMMSSSREVIDALDDLLLLGDELLRLAGFTQDDLEAMVSGLEPDVTFEDLSLETKQAILVRLANAADDLALAQAHIDIALEELSRVPRDELAAPILEALVPVTQKLQELQHGMSTFIIIARILPEFGGLDAPRTHLLLFANNTELRPGGGFLGSFGILRVHGGEIVSHETFDSYTLDNAALAAGRVTRTAPEPLRRYNAATLWFFRDGNWSPDFALSAREVMQMEREESGVATTFDGVIALTPTFVEDLLSITGPVSAGGQTFTAQNFADKLEWEVEYGYVGRDLPLAQRKEILGDLVVELKAALYRLPLSEWIRVLDAVDRNLREKQIALYSENAHVEDVLVQVGWGGRILPTTPDVQMVVDANLASLKTDPVVDRQITYAISQNVDGAWIGRTTIHYEHTGTFDWKTTRYRTYTRLYLPIGSEFIRAEGTLLDDARNNPAGTAGTVDVSQELDLTVFGAFTSVEPGQSRDLVFEYALAPEVVEAIEAGKYDLTFIKQIGAYNHALTLDLNFGKKVSNATPPEGAEQWGDDVYWLNTELDQDKTFSVQL